MPLLVGSRRALVVGAGLRTLAFDSFTDADGTALTSHTADTGQSWTKNATASNNTAAPTIDGNRAHGENASTASVYTLIAPAVADYVVSCDVVMRSDNNLSTCGPIGRLVSGVVTYYHVRYNTLGNVWQLFKWVANSATQLGADQAQTLTVDQAYRAELRMLGSLISMVVDGVVLVSVTDTAIPAAGLAGLKWASPATSTVGVHLDNVRVAA
jgi:hypothetical protein